MEITEFYDPTKASAFKFDTIGDTAAGIIAQEPELAEDKFNPGRKVLAVTLETDDGEPRAIYARAQMLEAIGEAVIAVGGSGIEQGGHLTVTYSSDKQLRSGRTMKVYTAVYVPPEPMGTAELGDTVVWGA